MPKSFLELENANRIGFTDLVETLRDSAKGGWPISFIIVRKLIERIESERPEDLFPEEARQLWELANIGATNQSATGRAMGLRQYKLLADHLQQNYRLSQ